MSLLQRNQQPVAEELLSQFPVLAIIGARQTGKTTLAKLLRPDWRYIDLENPNDYKLLTEDPILFFEQFPSDVIIDEAQLFPELFPVLRGVIDADRKKKGRFIITGSSDHRFNDHLFESLAGRLTTIEVGTLKANEYYQQPLSSFYELFKQKLTPETLVAGKSPLSVNEVNQVWLRGGYPEPVLEQPDTNFWQNWMENYHFNYINRDIAALFPRLNKAKYQRFIKMLANLSSTIINRSDLARALEISEKSARDYLNITAGTFIWRELLSYENSAVKSVTKMPKGYLRDTGLLHYLLNIRTLDELYTHPIVGHSFEGFVIEEVIKGLQAAGIRNWQTHYFRTRKGSGVDLILEGHFGVLPIEIKYSSHTTSKKLRSLEDFIEREQLPFGLVINQSSEALWLSKTVYQIPVGWI